MMKIITRNQLSGSNVAQTLEPRILLNASAIPSRPTSTIKLQSNTTYDFGGRTIDGSGLGTRKPLFFVNGAQNVTIKNLTVSGSPRYVLLVSRGDGLKISNFKMVNNSKSFGGIRFNQGYPSKNVQLNNISGSNIGGNAVELWDVDGYSIGNINFDNSRKSALMIHRSKNGRVGSVTGSNNSAATFRVGNKNTNVTVGNITSTNSSRGFLSLSGASAVTINSVKITGAKNEGIRIQGSNNIVIKSGTVSGSGKKNVLINGGAGIEVNVQSRET